MKNLILSLGFLFLSLPLLASEGIPFSSLIQFEEDIISLSQERYELSSEGQAPEKFKKLHHFLNNFGHQLLDQLGKDRPLNGHQLRLFSLGISSYLKASQELSEKLELIEPKNGQFSGQRDLLWMVHYTRLSQNYKQTFDLFYRNTVLRRAIKKQTFEISASLDDIKKTTKKVLDQNKLQKLEAQIESFLSAEADPSLESSALTSILSSSSLYKEVSQGESLKSFYRLTLRSIGLADGLNSALGTVGGKLSQAFGAVFGPIEWRKGYLHNNAKAKEELLKKLKPLDLILEKKGFKFTDYTIPGHWGHIGVWLGTEKQLKEINMWNHPIIKPFQEKIREGYHIYEVRRWGLVWEKLDNWLNVDEMAILRHGQVSQYQTEEYSKVFKELFSQIGKKYDYSFDVMTSSTITCTEIISLSYGPINWPTSKVMGKHTLQPENMAYLSLYNKTPLNLVSYLVGDDNGYKFETKKQFASKLGFKKSRSTGQYKKHFRKCKKVRYKGNLRTTGIRFKNKCWSEYEGYEYEAPVNNLEGTSL